MRAFLAPALALFAAGPALAALPPCAYEDLVWGADLVVQIADVVIGHDSARPNDCTVTGTVAHVLRGAAQAGSPVAVTVACEWDGLVGGTIYHDRAALEAAGMLELHLTGGEVAAYGDGLVIVPPGGEGRIAYVFRCGPDGSVTAGTPAP